MPPCIRGLAVGAAVLFALVTACAPVKEPPARVVPAAPPEPAPFSAGGEAVIYQDWQLTSLGLESWPDGELGVERSGDSYTFHPPRGGGVQTRTGNTLDAPAGQRSCSRSRSKVCRQSSTTPPAAPSTPIPPPVRR